MNEMQKIEMEIMERVQKLEKLRKEAEPEKVRNYSFATLDGEVTLKDLFGGKDKLFAIHNMGQGCRHCTLWADGVNAFLPHLEDEFAVVLLSKDDPETQRRFANSRGWRFRMASHGGGDYIREQGVIPDSDNYPGIVCYVTNGEDVFKKNSAVWGPGDLFCAQWHILSLAGVGLEEWTPQFQYWKRPEKLIDGNENVR
ncbi:MAG: DUF899 domain-containing protein [Planctomycetes bacterium]|nr:DUF899 domain-containing protein [Planctomycetota bacterium]